ncbi:hypothetical protein F4809DRAFT_657037 [Biscogniauxia mediterranea]|nr:hypothetical protein F4809DRAFT_657037 [Biscogniauxia mediterranea]
MHLPGTEKTPPKKTMTLVRRPLTTANDDDENNNNNNRTTTYAETRDRLDLREISHLVAISMWRTRLNQMTVLFSQQRGQRGGLDDSPSLARDADERRAILESTAELVVKAVRRAGRDGRDIIVGALVAGYAREEHVDGRLVYAYADAAEAEAALRDRCPQRRELMRQICAARAAHCGLVPERGFWMITDIAVNASFRGRGVGRGLLAAATERADRRGVGLLAVVHEDRHAAWLRRCGFVESPHVPLHGRLCARVVDDDDDADDGMDPANYEWFWVLWRPPSSGG